MSRKNHSKNQTNPQAVVTPDAREPQTNRAIPNQSHVKDAKNFVDQNKK